MLYKSFQNKSFLIKSVSKFSVKKIILNSIGLVAWYPLSWTACLAQIAKRVKLLFVPRINLFLHVTFKKSIA